MALNKISGGTNLYPPMTVNLVPGATYILPAGQGVVGAFGGTTQTFTGYTLTGQYMVNLGPYSSLQMYDSAMQIWRNVPAANGTPITVSSDGTNYRIANTTGCPIGAIITTAGTGLTKGFNTMTLVASSGGSTWNMLVGGALASSSIQVSLGGSNYAFPPQIIFTPTSQGTTPYIMPTAVAVLTSKSISSITVLSVGAGMVGVPSITVIPAPGDTLGGGALLIAPSVNVDGMTAVWPTNYGTSLTAAPTFSFTPSPTTIPVLTAVMNWTVTDITIPTAGASLGSSVSFALFTAGQQVTGTAGTLNAAYDKQAIFPRNVSIQGVTMNSGAVSQAGKLGSSLNLLFSDNGYGFQAVPNLFYVQQASPTGATSTIPIATALVGGQNDVCVIQPL